MSRRRKNRSEKRLEDEKAETINRLLKKQARPRAKKGTSTAVTPSAADTHTPSEDPEAGGEKAEESPAEVIVPHMWRWVSTSKQVQAEGEIVQEIRVLAIPVNAPTLAAEVSEVPSALLESKKQVNCACPVTPACKNPPKYRSTVKHDLWACSMDHLRQINASLVQV
jgi:Ino eighty subunit 2